MKSYAKILITFFVGVIAFLVTGSVYAQDISTLTQRAGEAGIERTAITELQSRAQAQGIDVLQLKAIIRSAIAMSEEDLPADAAIQKALEGMSKGISGGRIVSVVDRVHKSLSRAAKIVDPWIKKPEVQKMMKQRGTNMSDRKFRNELAKAASKSIIQNIPSETVNEILSQISTGPVLSNTGPSSVVAAIGILPDLPTAENNPQESGSFIVRALKGGFKADEFQKLPSAIKMAQQRSELPAASVIEGIGKQMQGDIPAKQILQNLFNGNVGGGPPGNIPKGLDNKSDRGGNSRDTG